MDDVDAVARGQRHRVEVTTESEPALPTDKFMEAVTRRRGWYKRRLGQVAAAGMQSILEEDDRPRGARHRRRVVTSAPDAFPGPRRCRRCLASRFAGCGEKTDYVRFAETEGIYVDVGNLVYQVQLSRYLNPGDVEDHEYLEGLPVDTPRPARRRDLVRRLDAGQELHGRDAAADRGLRDHGHRGERVPSRSRSTTSNLFAYNPGPLPRRTRCYPLPDTAAASGPIQGSLILFKLKNDSLQNRPLVLHIEQAGEEAAEIDLDL